LRGLGSLYGDGVVIETNDDPAFVVLKLYDCLATHPVFLAANILVPLLHQVVPELVHTVFEGLLTVNLDQLRERLALMVLMRGFHVQQLEKQLVTRLVVLLLVHIQDLILLVLEIDFEAVDSGDLMLLLDEVRKVDRAQPDVFEFAYLVFC
jgi:hypothetical protein